MSCKQTGNQVIVAAKTIPLNFDFLAWDITMFDTTGTGGVLGCIFNATPPGYEFDLVTDDQCLADTVPPAELGDEQASEFTYVAAYCPGGTESIQLETWMTNQQFLLFQIKFPGNSAAANGVERYFTGKHRIWAPDSIEKKVFMKVNLTAIRQSIIRERILP